MNDQEERLLLHAAIDGELDAAGALEMERMIAADPRLAAEQARLLALRRTLRARAPLGEAPAALRARALKMIEAATTARVEPMQRRWRDGLSWSGFGAALAATVAITLGLQNFVATRGSPDAVTQAVVSSHMRGQISGQPVDVISTDRHTVKPWLAAKLPVSAVVVDLARAGFSLLGGRVDIVAGVGAPTLVYKRREHLISVTELLAATGDLPGVPQRRALNGYAVVAWSDGGRGFEAVSDIAPPELDAFVAEFRRAAAVEQGAPPPR